MSRANRRNDDRDAVVPEAIQHVVKNTGSDRPFLALKLDTSHCYDIKEFKFCEELGKGAQGVVNKAKHILLGTCAVKQLSAATPESALGQGATQDQYTDYCRQFADRRQVMKISEDVKREFDYIHKVSPHDNIVGFRGYLTRMLDRPHLGMSVQLSVGIVFECMAGGTLLNLIQNDPDKLDYDHILQYAIGIARALGFLHEKCNIIHRHIDPSNIYLTGDLSVAKLGDFGYAREEDVLLKTSKKGNLKYMAPEVIGENEVVSYNFKSEVWSFSMLLYAMLTKREPTIEYDGKEVKDARPKRQRLIDGLRPRFDAFYRDQFTALVKLIENGWKYDPPPPERVDDPTYDPALRRPTMIDVLVALQQMQSKLR